MRRSNSVATYDYRSPKGRLVFQKLRLNPKGSYTDLPTAASPTQLPRKMLYRLPDLATAPKDAAIYVVEGEKDVDRLWQEGLVAACNADGGGLEWSGLGKWSPRYNRYFRGRDVVVLADRDYAGQIHAEEIERQLRRVARTVRRLTLPVGHKGDVSDFLDAGNTVEQLRQLVHDAPGRGPRLATRGGKAVRFALEARVSPAEKIVLIALACLESPSQADLALAANLSLPRVKAVLHGLRDKRLISSHKTGRAACYTLNYDLSGERP